MSNTNLHAFLNVISEKIITDPNLYVLTGDLGFKLFDEIKAHANKRFINAGVAEANMVGVAGGLALTGKTVYCYSIAPFICFRPFEQIRNDVCYHNTKVRLIGGGGGLIYGLEGMTHHTIEDFSVMRSLPNMTVVAPGDPIEAKQIAEQSITYNGPIYIRITKLPATIIHPENAIIQIGKGNILEQGQNICLISTGSMLEKAHTATTQLKQRGFNPTLVSFHTIKPLDSNLIKQLAQSHKTIYVIEEHSEIGGLGTAVAECLLENSYHGQFHKICLPDIYSPHSGSVDFFYQKYGLTPEAIKNLVLNDKSIF